MNDDTTIIPFHQPGSIIDPLTVIAREGARRMLMAALKAEAASFVAQFGDELLPDGRQRVVRHGAGPERTIQTGIGPITVQRQKVRDRAADVPPEARIRFTSNILPRWARRSKSLDALLPVLYLRGISTGDFQAALVALLGEDAPNLSPGVIARLTAGWKDEYDRWQRRDLSPRRYVYIWADGVYLQARMEPEAECILVIIGATPEGRKELLGFQVGVRESAQSWRELLVDLKARGLAVPPELAVGDGALGFWKALDEVFPGTRHQRCWFHKIANVINHFPKAMQPSRELRPSRYPSRRNPGRRAGRHRNLPGEIRRQICPRGDLPDQGHRGLACLLRFPGRALGSPAHLEPDRERVRHGPPSHGPHQGSPVAEDREADGLHPGQGGREDLAQAQRYKSVAPPHRGRQIHRRCRPVRCHPKPRRLISPRHPNSAIARFPFLERFFADAGYQGPRVAEAAPRPVEIVKRTDAGFVVQPKRWVVERTFAWACINRRLARDVERAVATAQAFFQIAMIKLMSRRIARYRDF